MAASPHRKPGSKPKTDPAVTTPATPTPTTNPWGLDANAMAAIAKLMGNDSVAAGAAMAGGLNGAAGRVGQTRQDETNDIASRYQSRLQGYQAPELQAMREQNSNAMNSQYQTQLHQQKLMQAKNGVRGPAAMAQMAGLQGQRMNAQAGLEQGLMVQQAQEQGSRLNDYAGYTEKQKANDYTANLENLNRGWSERLSGLGSLTGFAGLQASKENESMMQKMYQKMIDASKGKY